MRCWKTRTVLGGTLPATGLPLIGFAMITGPMEVQQKMRSLARWFALGIGAAIYGLGQAFDRLLDQESGEPEPHLASVMARSAHDD